MMKVTQALVVHRVRVQSQPVKIFELVAGGGKTPKAKNAAYMSNLKH
jgi:hypothetical protein